MSALIASVTLFTTVIVLLCITVLVARRLLTVDEEVAIVINGRAPLLVRAGDKLLWTLAEQNILIPAACGGRGSCGQCRVNVIGGSTELLPTEANHINPRDARTGVRLACMLKVQGDLSLKLPPAILDAQRYVGRVVSNRNLSPYLKELVLDIEPGMSFEAGDYILVNAPATTIRFTDFAIEPAYEAEWQSLKHSDPTVTIAEPTTRAYSLANAPGESNRLTLVVRIALAPAGGRVALPPGKVSSYIFSLAPGDIVNVTGPYGDFHALESDREMILVGGGAGIAPLRSIIHDQLVGRTTSRKISFWYGARNLQELCYEDEFRDLASAHENFTYTVALSAAEPGDRWQGPTGFIHRVLNERYLKTHPCPEEAEYYLCGPPLMSGAVLGILDDLGVDRRSILFDDFGHQY